MAKAKKKYGQHFLINDLITESIAHQILSQKEISNNILEVGPGKGVLSMLLRSANLKVVEIDIDMVHILVNNSGLKQSQIINEDFLKLPLTNVFDGEQFILAGNYPYNISSQIIFKMIEYRELIPVMIGMFQKEVAMRLLSKEGSKVYGGISVLMQAFYEGEKVIDVPPSSFNPPPKVDSMVIQLTRKDETDPICLDPLFKSIVKTSFGQRRKMLRNTLKSLVLDKELLKDEIFLKRPEHLSLEMFCSITNKIKESNESRTEN